MGLFYENDEPFETRQPPGLRAKIYFISKAISKGDTYTVNERIDAKYFPLYNQQHFRVLTYTETWKVALFIVT